MTAGPRPTPTFNAAAPDVAPCKCRRLHRIRTMPCAVTRTQDCSGCRPCKQEIIFHFCWHPKEGREGEIYGRRDGLWREGRQWGNYWDQILPLFRCRAAYILSMLYIWALVSERPSLLHYPPPRANLTCFQVSDQSSVWFFHRYSLLFTTLDIYPLIINKTGEKEKQD